MQDKTITLHLMGTIITIRIRHNNAEPLLQTIKRRLISYQARFSANDPNSDLMRVNNNAGKTAIKLDNDLFELIQIGKQQSLQKNSFLNIAIGPLIQAWRIGFVDASHPTDREINQLLPLIDPNNIILDPSTKTVFLAKQGMAIDLGSLAKGYFADNIITYLKMECVSSAIVDLGGNVVVLGDAPNHSDGYWLVGIQNPLLPRGHNALVLKAKNQAVVTSGIYERKLNVNSKNYHHIFDSKTGYPVETDIASITIVASKALDGEILTTQLYTREYSKKPEQVIRTLNQQEGIEGIVITTKGELAYTQGLASLVVE